MPSKNKNVGYTHTYVGYTHTYVYIYTHTYTYAYTHIIFAEKCRSTSIECHVHDKWSFKGWLGSTLANMACHVLVSLAILHRRRRSLQCSHMRPSGSMHGAIADMDRSLDNETDAWTNSYAVRQGS